MSPARWHGVPQRSPGRAVAVVLSSLLTLLAQLAVGGAAAGCDGDVAAEGPVEAPRHAAEFRSEQVRTVLDAAGQAIQTRGFASADDEWRGFLVEQGSAADEAALRGGTCYVFLGAGSDALRELDLRVFDSDGSEVSQDAQHGPGAALQYCPPHAGTYYVAALATSGTGLFAVRRYQGPTGLDLRLDDLFRDGPGAEPPAPERP